MTTRTSHAAPRTAGEGLSAQVPRVRSGAPVRAALEAVVGAPHQVADIICVLDADDHLRGVVRLADALAARPEQPVDDLLLTGVRPVRPGTTEEHAAHAALQSGVASVPVTDAEGRLLGVVPALALLGALYHAHVQDLDRLAGIRHGGAEVRRALAESPVRRARHRLPWLLVGLVGSTLATLLVSHYDALLQAHVVVASFLPGIVYLADAIGTQTETVAVRALSFGVPPLARDLLGELRTGVWIGAVLGILVFPAVALAVGDVRLGLAVAIALFFAGAIATGIGLLLPWALWRAGRDPAFGSGPLATVIQDVLSILVYFVVVSALLGA